MRGSNNEHGLLKKKGCPVLDKTGIRCPNKLGAYPDLCADHTLANENLCLRASCIPNAGYGLYAGPTGYRKGDMIAPLTDKSLGAFANDACKSPFRNNCHLSQVNGVLFIIASRDIAPMKEILVNMGNSYWQSGKRE
jgi:hypothetical protein